MERIKKNFGFGAMRLPMKDGQVDVPQTCRMVDAFLEAGFNYFDTAHARANRPCGSASPAAIPGRAMC